MSGIPCSGHQLARYVILLCWGNRFSTHVWISGFHPEFTCRVYAAAPRTNKKRVSQNLRIKPWRQTPTIFLPAPTSYPQGRSPVLKQPERFQITSGPVAQMNRLKVDHAAATSEVTKCPCGSLSSPLAGGHLSLQMKCIFIEFCAYMSTASI